MNPEHIADNILAAIAGLGMLIVLVWVGLAFLTGIVAGSKGRDHGAWALMALFGWGPIMLLAAVVIPTDYVELGKRRARRDRRELWWDRALGIEPKEPRDKGGKS
jgi:hypothetical protein